MNAELDPHDPLGPSDEQITRMRTKVHATIAADQSHTRRRRGWTIGGTLGLLVVLAGGTSIAMAAGVLQAPPWLIAAPAPAPTHTPTPAATAQPTRTPTPTAPSTPTPTPVAIAAPPKPRFAIGCDALTTESERTVMLGADSVAAKPNDPAAEAAGSPSALDSLIGQDAAAAAGALDCDWTDLAGKYTLHVEVTPLDTMLPGADGRVAGAYQSTDAPYWLGPNAWMSQLTLGGTFRIAFDDSTSHYTLELPETNYTAVLGASARIEDLENLGKTVRDRIQAAGGALADYAPPARVDPHFSCGTLAASLTAKQGTGIFREATPSGSQFTLVGGMSCAFEHLNADGSEPIYSFFDYLPGGTWDLHRFQSTDSGALDLTEIDGIGDKAYAGCAPMGAGQPDQCWVHVFADQAWLDVRAYTSDENAVIAIAANVQSALSEAAR